MKFPLILALAIFYSIGAFSQSAITSPLNRSIYQRGNDGNATVWIAGQIFTGTKPTTIQYRTVRLDNFGASIDSPSYTNIPASSIQLGRIYRHSIVRSTGWYRLEVRGLDINSNTLTSYTMLFGVGEVFVFAGQSNARGTYTDNVNQSIVNPPDGFVYENISMYDNDVQNCNSALVYPSFSNLYPYGDVGPYGQGVWAYGRFAKKIVENKQVPVMIFNASQNGTWIENWRLPATGNPTNAWLCTGTMYPYEGLRNVVNLFASIYGIRAIVWYQGEQDAAFGTTENNYKNDLKTVINAIRSDFDNKTIPWVISKASYVTVRDNNGNITFQGSSSNITNAQQGVVNETSQTTLGATNQDDMRSVTYTLNGNTYTKSNRQSDQTHFSDAGLLYLADDYYSKIDNILNLTPIMGNDLGNIQVQQLSSSMWRLTASGPGVTTYRWKTGFCSYDNNNSSCNTATSSSIDRNDGWWNCYMRNAKGNFILSPRISLPMPINGARVSYENLISVKVFPNPITQGDDIKLEFELMEDSNDFSLSIYNSDGNLVKMITELPHGKGKYTYNVATSGISYKGVAYLRLTSNGYMQTDRLYIDK